MDYLDELDHAAIAAFEELGADRIADTWNIPSSSNPIAENLNSTRNRRIPPMFLLKLDDPINPWIIAGAAGLKRLPPTTSAQGETGTATFCYLPQPSLLQVETWLRIHHPKHRPTTVKVVKAHKDDNPPTLGIDPTLPQNRPNETSTRSRTIHYPIWYFFYGTLTNRDTLGCLLNLPTDTEPKMCNAWIKNGEIKMWQKKYKALIDKPGGVVHGWAYLVASPEHEVSLRVYETDNYEVVRTTIVLDGQNGKMKVPGYTFRFAGYEDELGDYVA
ncbi:hypothetical protein B0J11DRAFT_536445 [Dendryphion nanum]|uniref:Putative gamma-glutamylcyclotransferase n=1 Tax=Dendryphion nanum TaxID=256645 RepID=A0A9P9IFN9_9PLEO|nr:hypothetical protein B0J11DRAFT_536445 [Dendryphion nanum]